MFLFLFFGNFEDEILNMLHLWEMLEYKCVG